MRAIASRPRSTATVSIWPSFSEWNAKYSNYSRWLARASSCATFYCCIAGGAGLSCRASTLGRLFLAAVIIAA